MGCGTKAPTGWQLTFLVPGNVLRKEKAVLTLEVSLKDALRDRSCCLLHPLLNSCSSSSLTVQSAAAVPVGLLPLHLPLPPQPPLLLQQMKRQGP